MGKKQLSMWIRFGVVKKNIKNTLDSTLDALYDVCPLRNKKLSTSSTSSSQQPKQSKHSKPFAVFKKMQFHSSAVGQHATITNNCNDNDNGAVIEPFINLAEKAVYNFLVKNERIIPLETVKAFVAKQCSPISRDFCNADLLCMLNFILENINIFLKESVFHGHWSDHALQDVAILACEVIICFGRNYEEAFASKENVDNEIIKRWIDKASRKRKLDEMLIIMNANASSKRSLDDTNLGKITGFFLDILEELKETKKGDKKKVLKLTMDENEYMLKF
ncbi:15326_t:CDS:2 [Entrophospora sp. SA101]|nr:15326_t:CDS:2 [Entrophospora sp. SA101]